MDAVTAPTHVVADLARSAVAPAASTAAGRPSTESAVSAMDARETVCPPCGHRPNVAVSPAATMSSCRSNRASSVSRTWPAARASGVRSPIAASRSSIA